MVIDRLSRDLGRSVVINDPAMRLLHASPHFGDEDEVRIRAILHRGASSQAVGHVLGQGVSTWSTPGVIPARHDIGMSARVCFPVRVRGELLGLLMVMDADSTMTTAEMDDVSAVVLDLGSVMFGDRAASTVQVAAEEKAVIDLLSRDPRVRLIALDDLRASGTLPDLPYARATVLTIGPDAGVPDRNHLEIAIRHALRGASTSLRGATLSAVDDGVGVLLQLSSTPVDDTSARRLGREMVAQVDDVAAGRFTATAGIGETRGWPADAWESYRQAVIAARAVPVLALAQVATYAELGVFSTLLRVPDADLDCTAVPAPLQRLFDADRGDRLVDTLRAYLECGCSGPAAAEALHIHKTTLYYRLGRIREVADVDLEDGSTRLLLHLGLKIAQLLDHRVRPR